MAGSKRFVASGDRLHGHGCYDGGDDVCRPGKIVVRSLGLDAAGLFQAAATLSTLYIGVILTAMGADFYPRLTAVASTMISPSTA